MLRQRPVPPTHLPHITSASLRCKSRGEATADTATEFSQPLVAPACVGNFLILRWKFRAPLQNSICERWIGSLRRELLDHVVVFNERHARRLVGEYVRYHQIDRCHLFLAKDAPAPRPVQQRPPGNAEVIAIPRVGGIHHRYEWRDAA